MTLAEAQLKVIPENRTSKERAQTRLQQFYGPDWQEALKVGANAAGMMQGLTRRKDQAVLLHSIMHDPLTLPSRRYLLALRVSLMLLDKASCRALILALRAQPRNDLETVRVMLSERLEELVEAPSTAWMEAVAPEVQPPPQKPIQARPQVRPGAPFHL